MNDYNELTDCKVCPVCGERFTPTSSNQKYCSIECRAENANSGTAAEAARIRNRDRMRVLRAKQAELRANANARYSAECASELAAEVEQREAERKADRERRAADGNIFAMMQVAIYDEHDGEKYFALRSLYEESERQRIAEMFRDN